MPFQDFIRTLYALPPGRSFACSTIELEAAEDRLGIALPTVLRRYYQTLGRHEGINQSHNCLLLPPQLYFSTEGCLIFYAANTGVTHWGIRPQDLARDNPPVWKRHRTDPPSHWRREVGELAAFLQIMAVTNGTLGGLKYHAYCLEPLSPRVVADIEALWPLLLQLSGLRQRIYSRQQQDAISLTFDQHGHCNSAFIGSQDQDRFDEALDILDIHWSYVSYEDEGETTE